MRPIDSNPQLDPTSGIVTTDSQSTAQSPATGPAVDQPVHPPDSGAAALKRMERDLESLHFKGALDNAGSPPPGQVLYDRDKKPDGKGDEVRGDTSSSDVQDLLKNGAKNADPTTKQQFKEAQDAIAKGDFTKAHEIISTLMRKQGEEVLSDSEVKSTYALKDQLEFCSQMQKAGVKSDLPPTEQQLVDYFKTLKNNPAAARQAFEDYTKDFHVHAASVTGNSATEVDYGKSQAKYGSGEYTVGVPKDFNAVTSHPVSAKQHPEFIDKQMNDCKGYGLMADKLLGAAGFTVKHYVDAYPSYNNSGHEMVVLTHPKETGYTLTSNGQTFHGANEKDLAQKGYEAAAGKENVTGKEQFYFGKTAADAMIQMSVKDDKL